MSATMQAVIAVLPEGLSRRVAALQTRAFDYDRAINRASAEFDDLMRARKNGDFPVEQHPPVIPGYHWICLPYSTLSGLGSVKTLHRNGIYAVHEDDGEFSIDHLPTGLRVMAFRSFGIAKGLVDMLAKVHPNAHKNAAYGETMRGMQLQVDSVRYFVDNVIKPADVKHTLLGGYSVKRAGKDGSYTFLSADGETEKAKYDGYAWRKASGYAVDNRLLSILNNSSWAPSEGNVQFAFSEKEQEHAKSPAGELMPGRVKFIVDGVDVTAVALGPPDRGRQTWRAFETGKDPVNGDLGRTTINTDDGIAGLKRSFGGVL